jgi:opacity protein-like surface antigen
MNKQTALALIGLSFIATSICEAAEIPTLNIGASWMLVGYNDEDKTPYKINAGYTFNKHYAIEVNYFDFGGDEAPAETGTLLAEGYSIEFIAKYPMNDFSVYAKLGNMWWSEEGDSTLWWEESRPTIHLKNSGSDTIYGVGASYSITNNLSVKVEYLQSSINEKTANPFSLGFDLRF